MFLFVKVACEVLLDIYLLSLLDIYLLSDQNCQFDKINLE